MERCIYSISATEAHDDDGLPHTLEHLIFMGSEDYPFKVFTFVTFYHFPKYDNAATDNFRKCMSC